MPGVHRCSKKSRRFLKILEAIRTTRRKSHTEDPQILGATVQNLVALATWHQEFVHPWTMLKELLWVFSVYTGKTRYRNWKHTTTCSFHILFNSSFSIRQSLDDAYFGLLTNKMSVKQATKQTNKQTNKQTDRQTDRHSENDLNWYLLLSS